MNYQRITTEYINRCFLAGVLWTFRK